MHVVAVESSTLAAVGYDASGQWLQLEFRSRAVYSYFDVPATVHQALLKAESKGSFFNRCIRGRFPYRRVSGRCGERDSEAGRRGQE